MSQHDYNIANQTFPATRTDLNNALGAIATNNAGNSAPATTYSTQWWFDNDDNKLYLRNKDNDNWVEILTIGATSDKVESIGVDDLTFADNSKLILGTGGDLEIYHDGSNSYIDDAGTGRLFLRGNDRVQIQKYTGEDMISCLADGAVNIYHDNAKKFETTATGVDVTGAFTATAASTITTADNTDTLSLVSTDADANVGPNLRLYRNSSSPADSDILGQIDFEGRNDNSQDFVATQIKVNVGDVSDGTEDAQIEFDVMTAGTLREYLRMASGSEPSVVINEDSQDIDFRVESNGNANMLMVNGGGNRVGIGADPDLGVGLHIKSADSGASVDASADELVLEGSANVGLSILSGASNNGSIYFGDSGLNYDGYIAYSQSDRKITFGTAGAAQWAIDSSGNLLPTATDHGIYLGVNSATASNLLDDYETGTFTPTLNGSAGAPSGVSYNKRLGWYEKIGDMVTVHVHLDAASMTAVPAGALTVTGLPFTCVNTTGFLHAGVVSLTSNFASTESPQANYINPNTTALNFLCNDSNDARDNIGDAITCANAMSGNETLIASCTYRSA
jgi:hypothetical protein